MVLCIFVGRTLHSVEKGILHEKISEERKKKKRKEKRKEEERK
jgi:hypothetical protein